MTEVANRFIIPGWLLLSDNPKENSKVFSCPITSRPVCTGLISRLTRITQRNSF